MSGMMRSVFSAFGLAMAATTVFVAGCGDAGPQMYSISGKVTYGGKTIGSGDVRFEPKEGLKNLETVAFSKILDGKYATEVTGGPHWVYVRDFTGDVDMGDPNNAGGKPLFQMEYRGAVELPSIEEAKGSSPVVKDIEVPTTHK